MLVVAQSTSRLANFCELCEPATHEEEREDLVQCVQMVFASNAYTLASCWGLRLRFQGPVARGDKKWEIPCSACGRRQLQLKVLRIGTL